MTMLPRPEKLEAAGRESLPFITLLPNMVTTLGLCAGLTAIRFVMAGEFRLAVALILFSVLVDGLDGLVARRLNVTSDLGAQLDSLSDFVNFGVVPGLLVYEMALSERDRPWGWIFVMVYTVCCCIRLARFNVEQARDQAAGDCRPATHFTGVPSPAGAMMAMLPAFVTFETGIRLSNHPTPVAIYILVVGLLMVSRIPTFSPKSIRIPKERAVWVLVGLAVFVGTMLAEFWKSLIFVVLLYAASLVYAALKAALAKR